MGYMKYVNHPNKRSNFWSKIWPFSKKQRVSIDYDTRASMVITTIDGYSIITGVDELTPDQKFEKVKTMILGAGYYFSDEIERKLRSELNL